MSFTKMIQDAFRCTSCLSLFVAVSCCHAEKVVGKYSCDDLIENFFYGKEISSQISEFSKRQLDEQYAIYICGNQVVHPPAIYLATPFANKGGAVVDWLEKKLEDSGDDLVIRDIVNIFAEMKRVSSYSVEKNKYLLALIERKARAMNDSGWRKIVEQMVAEIKK